MSKTSRKHRLNPSKLLVMLLYGTYPYLEVEDEKPNSKQLRLEVGKFGRLMRVKNAHIREYVQWLENMGYLTQISSGDTHISIILSKPTLFSQEVGS